MLDAGPISSLAPERHVQELLYQWTQVYFTGQPHQSKLGDRTFPVVDVFFNQTQIPSPTNKPQLHFMFTDFRKQETWHSSGNLSAWQDVLARPASGVSYGLTIAGTVEESIHGKLARTLRGIDIRWHIDGAGVHEQVFRNTWEDVRFFAGATAIRIRKAGNAYIEEVQVGAGWLTQRTITVGNPLWDGTKKLVTIDTMIGLYIRTVNAGEELEATDHLCRAVASNFTELMDDETARALLTRKGFRRIRVARGPAAMPSTGFQTRMIVLDAQLRYYIPREQ